MDFLSVFLFNSRFPLKPDRFTGLTSRLTGGNRLNYHFYLKFEFNLVFSGYRSNRSGLPEPDRAGFILPVGKKKPCSGRRLLVIQCLQLINPNSDRMTCTDCIACEARRRGVRLGGHATAGRPTATTLAETARSTCGRREREDPVHLPSAAADVPTSLQPHQQLTLPPPARRLNGHPPLALTRPE